MNRFQAMALIMARLKAQNHLKPSTPEHKLARRLVAELIDLCGPDAAVRQVAEANADSLVQIERLCIQRRIESGMPSISF